MSKFFNNSNPEAEVKSDENEDALQIKYHPASNVCTSLDTVVPKSMAIEQMKFNDRLRGAISAMGMSVEQYVAKKLRYRSVDELCYQDKIDDSGKLVPMLNEAGEKVIRFSAEQIDALATAIWQYEVEDNAIILADQAGSGKGRVAAGVIRYAIVDQKKVPLFFTEKKHLINDIYRDLIAIGFDAGVPEFIVDKEKRNLIDTTNFSDEEVFKIILKDIKSDDDVRVEYDFPTDIEDDDFNLGVLLRRVKEDHKWFDRIEEIKAELVELYRQYFAENGYEKEIKPEKNPYYDVQVAAALRNGRSLVVPFVPNRIDIKDINGNILYEAMTKPEADAIYKVKNGKAADPTIDISEFVLPAKYKLFAIPYSQLSFGYEKVTGGKAIKNKIRLFQKYSHDSILILDESHNASGSKDAKADQTKETLSAAAQLMFGMVKSAKMATYISATFAKRANNMPLYALKTSIKESGLSDNEMITVFANGGTALQEAVSVELVKNGQLLRREKVIQGETKYYYENEGTQVGDNQIAKLDRVASMLKLVFNFSKEVRVMVKSYAKRTADDRIKNARSVNALSFNIFNFMLLGMKINQTTKYSIEKLQSGRKTVIAVANTMESVFDNLSKTYLSSSEKDKYKIGEKIKNDFSLYIAYLLQYTMRYSLTEVKVDPEGNEFEETKTIHILDSDDALSEEIKGALFETYELGLKQILSFEIGIPIAPLDMIERNIKQAGFKVDEITRRGRKLVFSEDDYSYGILEKREIRPVDAIVRGFNENETDCLLINQSGASGLSMHSLPNEKINVVYKETKDESGEFVGAPTSLENKKEVKKRAMVITQMELDINKEVQKLGRINRNGQVYEPEYTYIVSAIPSESRLTALQQSKLKSLMSNVSGYGEQASYLFSADDFFSEAALEPFNETIYQVNGTGLQAIVASKPAAIAAAIKDATKSLYFKPYSIQKEFYDTFSKKLQTEIQKQIAQGTYTGRMFYKNYYAETAVKHPFFIGNKNAKTTFGKHSFIEKCNVKIFKERFTEKKIAQQITDSLKIKTSYEGESGEDDLFLKLSDFQNKANDVLSTYENQKRDLISRQLKELHEQYEEEARKVEDLNKKLSGFKDLSTALQLEKDLEQYRQFKKDASFKITAAIDKGDMEAVTTQTAEINRLIPLIKDAEEKLKPMEEILKQKGEHRSIERDVKYGMEDLEKINRKIERHEKEMEDYSFMISEGKAYLSKIGGIFELTEYETNFIFDEDSVEEVVKEASRIAKFSRSVVLTGISFPHGYSYLTPGKFELFLSDATEKYTYNLYQLAKKEEHTNAAIHVLYLTSVDYKGKWNEIIGNKDTSVLESRYMITGSMLKTFSLGRANGISGQIVKFNTIDGKMRLGIEVADKEDAKSGRKSVYKMLEERYGDTTNLQYPIYYDGNETNITKFIADYIHWYLFGETYTKEVRNLSPEESGKQPEYFTDTFYFQVASKAAFQMLAVHIPNEIISAANQTSQEYNRKKALSKRISKEELLGKIEMEMYFDSINFSDFWAFHLNKATGVEINSDNYAVAGRDKKGEPLTFFKNANVVSGRIISKLRFRRGDQFKTLFPTNIIELEDMLNNGNIYVAQLSMNYEQFVNLMNLFDKKRLRPTFSTASGYFDTIKGEYLLDEDTEDFIQQDENELAAKGEQKIDLSDNIDVEINELIEKLTEALKNE